VLAGIGISVVRSSGVTLLDNQATDFVVGLSIDLEFQRTSIGGNIYKFNGRGLKNESLSTFSLGDNYIYNNANGAIGNSLTSVGPI